MRIRRRQNVHASPGARTPDSAVRLGRTIGPPDWPVRLTGSDWTVDQETNLGGAVQERQQLAYSGDGRPIVVASVPGSTDTFGRCRTVNGDRVTVDCLLLVIIRSLGLISLIYCDINGDSRCRKVLLLASFTATTFFPTKPEVTSSGSSSPHS